MSEAEAVSLPLQWETVSYTIRESGVVVLIEIIPTDGHEESGDCWCGPWVSERCGNCEDGSPGCWRCGGRGLVDYDRWSGEVPIILHEDSRLP